MTGVINVGVRLPAVIFPVVIRPSGGLTLLISLSVSLFGFCLFALCCSSHVSPVLFASVRFSSSAFFFFFSPYLFHLFLSQCASHIRCMSAILIFFFKWCSLTLISLQPFAALCPEPLHSNLCNGNPLMYAAILVLQYVNWRDIGPHLWMGSTSL